ncbi:MAG TPA: hypothetical protein VFV02_06400, partial [Acidimicrobiales bacterium]|nr:hypothetical protein [Acidimicrobiales bacterium]
MSSCARSHWLGPLGRSRRRTLCPAGPHRQLSLRLAGGEVLDHLVSDVVVVLDRRRLHEVG